MEQKRLQPATLYKAAGLEAQEVTEEELRAINKHAIDPLTADEVFVFSAVLCDSAVDRQFEYFSPKALHDMQKLFLGRTVIKDHNPAADNQIARIYHTEVVDTGKKMDNGEPYMQLKARCYMVRTASNADLITEIRAGIKREGSVGFRPSSAICSVCQTDNVLAYCRHWPGKTYDKEGGKQLCTIKLDGVSDCYEFSLVGTPAQRAAGVTKSYTGETVTEKDFPEEEAPIEETPAEVIDKAAEVALRARLAIIKAKHNTTHNDEN